MKFRKKPVVIEAVQYNGENYLDIADWVLTSTSGEFSQDEDECGPFLVVDTLEGKMQARVGDWIIKGVQGEIYPCKPDIFAATYEPATEEKQSYSSKLYRKDELTDLMEVVGKAALYTRLVPELPKGLALSRVELTGFLEGSKEPIVITVQPHKEEDGNLVNVYGDEIVLSKTVARE